MIWAYIYASDGTLLMVCPKRDLDRWDRPGYRVSFAQAPL